MFMVKKTNNEQCDEASSPYLKLESIIELMSLCAEIVAEPVNNVCQNILAPRFHSYEMQMKEKGFFILVFT